VQRKVKTLSFLRGLETTGAEDGLELPAWAQFQNTRLDTGSAKRRPGSQRVLTATNQASALDFVAADADLVTVKGYAKMAVTKNFTVGAVIQPDTVTGTQYICAFDSADAPYEIYLDGSTVKATIGTAGGDITVTGGTAAINTTCYIQLVWRVLPSDTSKYEAALWTNGVQGTTQTGTYSAPDTPGGNFLIGGDGSSAGNHFDGTIDFVRVLDVAWDHARFSRMRLPDPKASYVLLDMPMEIANTTTLRVDDRGPQRIHGTASSSSSSGAPSSTTTIATQVSPVSYLGQRTDYTNKSRVDVVAGGKFYLAEL